ncbi:hypothetical protein GCM10025734_04550 [Kitasatospora paranensis]
MQSHLLARAPGHQIRSGVQVRGQVVERAGHLPPPVGSLVERDPRQAREQSRRLRRQSLIAQRRRLRPRRGGQVIQRQAQHRPGPGGQRPTAFLAVKVVPGVLVVHIGQGAAAGTGTLLQ